MRGFIAGLAAAAVLGTYAAGGDGWREFTGSWNATGSLRTLHLGGDRRAATGEFTGTLLLSGSSRPGVGFRAEAIAFSDTDTGMVGRAVWTDENGDKVYSEIRGDGPRKGGKVAGTFTGGTGRYAGATGAYAFTWRYVIGGEEGAVQASSVDLKGRIRP
ncbi:MAG TPA: hypothetical protein VH301_14450 [Usitatibacter sp.]|jgi:hypothetical protein|nr:hypothetical protein [Usitatibacter sp.]